MSKLPDKSNYVDQAEKIMLEIKNEKYRDDIITTNKIRNMLTLMTELYNAVKNQHSAALDDNIRSRIGYTRMRLVYEAGRDRGVKNLLNKSELLDYIKSINNRDSLMLVCHYMEALVAYHKYYIDKQ